jgi:RNA polymerase sigma factor (TIGR02999 family)
LREAAPHGKVGSIPLPMGFPPAPAADGDLDLFALGRMDDPTEITADLSGGWKDDPEADSRVWSQVYQELRDLAHRELLRERPGHTLVTTDLVHEAYVKLVGQADLARRDRAHFFALACRAMRQVLVEYARRRNAEKRTPEKRAVPLREAMDVARTGPRDLLALDEALSRLSGFDPRLGQVVELRFFGGLTTSETAEVLELSPRTVERDWSRARAYLYRMLAPD